MLTRYTRVLCKKHKARTRIIMGDYYCNYCYKAYVCNDKNLVFPTHNKRKKSKGSGLGRL